MLEIRYNKRTGRILIDIKSITAVKKDLVYKKLTSPDFITAIKREKDIRYPQYPQLRVIEFPKQELKPVVKPVSGKLEDWKRSIFLYKINTKIRYWLTVIKNLFFHLGCPKQTPDSFDTCEGSMTCTYGEECCCGKCHTSLVANCDAVNKKWIMYFTDACLGADSLCPSTSKF